jgi:hypothetical protein
MNRRSTQQGIALITTLIMLAVVTLMAVAFLSVSRRERSAVTTSSDRLDARAMSETALQRAEAEILSRVQATTNLLSYDLLVSTNYLNPLGFVADDDTIANVSFVYANGSPVVGNDLLQLYRNLMIDPRAPVFITTNTGTGEQDFRYFLDFNRNGLFETNGVQPELGLGGLFLGFTNYHVGDPEWIGVLRRPDYPHSGTNVFLGRFAYLVVPAGKTLDLNFIHNQAKRIGVAQDGYLRNQGMGSWELNLAAFLRDLNTNAWTTYLYRTNPLTPSSGISFDNALVLLRERYRTNAFDPAPSYQRLDTVRNLFGPAGAGAFIQDGLDGYADGPLQLDLDRPYTGTDPDFVIQDNDNPTQPWPGSDQPGQYFDPQELFALSEGGPVVDLFTNRLMQVSRDRSTYDRHTFYRLLGQLGTDSWPNNGERIHLNYDNRLDFDRNLEGQGPSAAWGYHATNFVLWTPAAFFTNAADRMVKALHPLPGDGVPLLAVTNIQIWPTNTYSPGVHRSLQLAANIYDATGNRGALGPPHFPSVFRPLFGPDPAISGGLRITGYREVTNDWDSVLWSTRRFDLDEPDTWPASVLPLDRFAGLPAIVGARKGFPAFNEFELQTMVVATRKLELVKRSPQTRPAFTNQMYTLGISNVFGVEFWNSYVADYPRPLELRARLDYSVVLSNETRVIRVSRGTFGYTNTFAADEWRGRQFQIPIYTNLLFLPNSVYRLADGNFYPIRTNNALNLFEPALGFATPVWRLHVTNRLQAVLVDRSAQRIVDYVDLDNLNSSMDITRELFGQQSLVGETSQTGQFWQTNRVAGIPEGVRNQIQASLGQINISSWNSVSSEPTQGQEKEKAISRFRQFLGLDPQPANTSPTLRMQAPLSPGLKLLQNKSWQVNDPLVNKFVWDLEDPTRSNVVDRLPPLFVVDQERSNIGQINHRYRPWQRNLYSSGDDLDFNMAVKDPQVVDSDHWNFPTNALPSVGWLGRIHRGTPWQTVYLKSAPVSPVEWQQWSGHPDWYWRLDRIAPSTQPTNDWRILDLFTTAVHDNASRGALSVNQAGLAAWSAVFSGVPVLTNEVPGTNVFPQLIEPSTQELRLIVQDINATRAGRFGGKFNYRGEILSTPSLSDESPYLRMMPTQNGTPADAVVERIPQMTLSLMKGDEPRFIVYSFGQSLRPAQGSVVTDLGPFFQMPTNYVITGEYVTKTLVRLEEFQEPHPTLPNQFINRIRAVKENYNEVFPEE